MGAQLAQILVEGCINGSSIALVAIGIALIWGVMGLLCFAQGEFLMIGMYVAYFMMELFGWDPLYSMPLCALVLFVIGLVVYYTMVRRVLTGPKLSQRLLTFGLSMMLANIALYFFKSDYRTIKDTDLIFHGNLQVMGLSIAANKLVPLAVCVALTLALCVALTLALYLFLNCTRFGKSIQAVSQDKDAAALMGIDADRAYAIAFALSCAITGAAGGVLTYYYYISPTVGTTFQLFGFIAVSMGGFGSVVGAFAGGIIMGIVDIAAGFYLNTALKYLFVCIGFIIIISFKPKGLFGR